MKPSVGTFASLSIIVAAAGGCSAAAPEAAGGPEQNAEAVTAAGCPLQVYAGDYTAGHPVASVRVCAVALHGSSAPICDTTDAAGLAAVRIPGCGDVRVTYEASGYVPSNQLVRLDGSADVAVRMLTPALVESQARALGTTVDPTKALVLLQTRDRWHEATGSVSMTYVPASGVAYYADDTGLASSSVQMTGLLGIAGAVNVTPGGLEVDASLFGLDCGIAGSVPGAAASSVRVEAVAGSVAQATFFCGAMDGP